MRVADAGLGPPLGGLRAGPGPRVGVRWAAVPARSCAGAEAKVHAHGRRFLCLQQRRVFARGCHHLRWLCQHRLARARCTRGHSPLRDGGLRATAAHDPAEGRSSVRFSRGPGHSLAPLTRRHPVDFLGGTLHPPHPGCPRPWVPPGCHSAGDGRGSQRGSGVRGLHDQVRQGHVGLLQRPGCSNARERWAAQPLADAAGARGGHSCRQWRQCVANGDDRDESGPVC
mmetsp:Transcript_118321/g.330008  ORF Transcript_118321/g.330008 Transcript_118321/m.330008 type:complete len:227 (-) Transcript_118321:409-1089(-)